MSSGARDLKTTLLPGHETSPLPKSTFGGIENTRDVKIKSNLKNVRKLQVELEVQDDWQNKTYGWNLGSHLGTDMITFSGSAAIYTVS